MDYLKSKETLDAFINEYQGMVDGIDKKDPVLVKSGEVFIEWAQVIQSLLEDFNHIKFVMDCCHSSGRVEQFEEKHRELCELLSKHDFTTMMQRVKARKRWYKKITPLREHMLSQIGVMKNARDGGAKWIKRMKMSPAQKKSADKASQRMSARWGMA